METYDHVYLSPHFDDAVFSCGGAIHQQCQNGQAVLVVTFCAAMPDPGEPLSPLAERFHAWMGHPADVVAARRREDRAALAIVGAEGLWLDFKDCIYRGRSCEHLWHYTSIREVFGRIHPNERTLAEVMAVAVNERVSIGSKTTIYAPLGVGNHVDHQLTHCAAWVLHAQQGRLVLYEDYPYADPDRPHPIDESIASSPASTLAATAATLLAPRFVHLSEADLQAKIDGVRAYRSQLAMLFGEEAAIPSRLRTYASRHDPYRLAERFWIPG